MIENFYPTSSMEVLSGESKGGTPLAYWGIFSVVERSVKKMP
ncbi:hypothetical protein [Viscerimonas tarda]